jgi:ribosomal protein L40E
MSPKELQELRERMSEQSDTDLLKIVNVDFKDYRKETIELARVEVEKRGLSHRLLTSPTTPRILLQEQTKKQVGLSPNVETMKCRFCGSAISATATECDNCGYGTPYGARLMEEQLLEEASAKSVITLINCPACNSEVSNQAVACPKCGQPINAPPPVKVSPRSNFTPLKGTRSYTRETTIGIILLVVSGSAFFWARNYMDTHFIQAGFSGMLGRPDQTYQVASLVIMVSPIGFILGLILLVVGLVRK